ncbi:MAG: lipid-A-disaccharide synthase, partial [Candidatus Rokuibacteriota bacterium]
LEGRPAPRIMLVAGEASGDVHGAALCRALNAAAPGARLFGMGGNRMAAAGLDVLADIRATAVVGFSEVVRRLPLLRRTYGRLVAALASEHPHVLVLIDYPGFNLRLARVARDAGVPVVYFIPPQIWAWRPGRLQTIRRRVSLVLAVFPFERALYGTAGVPVEFVGHPVLDALPAAPTRAAARRQLGVDGAGLVIGLLPGSRSQEIERLLPLMRDAATRIAGVRPGARFVLGLAPSVARASVDRHLAGGSTVEVVEDRTYAVMRASDLLLVASGTATLEAALLGTPMVVCYRLSAVSERIAAVLARVPWVSLANIVLGRRVVPELCRRRDATGERLAREALRLLDTPGALDAQRQAFRELEAELGAPGVGARAARLVLDVAGNGGVRALAAS